MKRTFLRFMMLVLGVLLSLQASAIDDNGVYYLKNVETGKYLNRGNAWGTHAVLDFGPLPVRLISQPNGSYTIHVLAGSFYQELLFRVDDTHVYIDYNGQETGCPYWTFTDAGNGNYYIQTLTTHTTYGQEAMPGTYLGNDPTKEAQDGEGKNLGYYNDVDGNILNEEGMNITWSLEPLTTFEAPVPCGEGTVNIIFNVTNNSPREVEVLASPINMTGALTIPASVIDTSSGLEYAVKSIGKSAFEQRNALTSVTIADGITTIDNWAFQSCRNIESISLPESVENIYGAAFAYMPKLTTINLPTQLTEIADWLFAYCPALKSINIPEGVTTIRNNSFMGSGIESIKFPTALTEIEYEAFRECNSLKSIDFNGCSAFVEYKCFSACRSLEELFIPNTVEFRNSNLQWAWGVFEHCSSLKKVVFEAYQAGQMRWGKTAMFANCTALESIVLPSLNIVEQYFFQNCENIKTVTILEIENDFSTLHNNYAKIFGDSNAEQIQFIVPDGTAEIMLKAGYMYISDLSGLPLIRQEFEDEAARIVAMANALTDGEKETLLTAIAEARIEVNAAEDYAPIYAQIAAIKTAAKTYLGTATLPKNFDVTAAYITNPDFERLQIGWDTKGDYVVWPNTNNRGWNGGNYENGDVVISNFIESWENTTLQDIEISQTVTALPAGRYRLEADIIATNQKDANAAVTGMNLFAGAKKTPVATENGKPQHFTLDFALYQEGDCPIGINTSNTNTNWVAMDNVRLYCLNKVKNGDTNGDGKVTITDAVAIVSHILGEDIDGFVAAAADVDGNGRITITDAVAIVDMILSGTALANERVDVEEEVLDPQ